MASASPTIEPLPTIDDRPDAEVVIYDGHCNFCTAQVRRLSRWDSGKRLAFVSLHDARVRERYPSLSHDYLMTNMVLVDRNGRSHSGADAFREIAARFPRLWPLAMLMRIPGTMPFWRWGYRQFAKRRYLLSGKTECDGDTCAVHFR